MVERWYSNLFALVLVGIHLTTIAEVINGHVDLWEGPSGRLATYSAGDNSKDTTLVYAFSNQMGVQLHAHEFCMDLRKSNCFGTQEMS